MARNFADFKVGSSKKCPDKEIREVCQKLETETVTLWKISRKRREYECNVSLLGHLASLNVKPVFFTGLQEGPEEE